MFYTPYIHIYVIHIFLFNFKLKMGFDLVHANN